VANFVPLNGADDILDLLLEIGMIGLGLALTRNPNATRNSPAVRTLQSGAWPADFR
jgi:hypothetical protein